MARSRAFSMSEGCLLAKKYKQTLCDWFVWERVFENVENKIVALSIGQNLVLISGGGKERESVCVCVCALSVRVCRLTVGQWKLFYIYWNVYIMCKYLKRREELGTQITRLKGRECLLLLKWFVMMCLDQCRPWNAEQFIVCTEARLNRHVACTESECSC